MNQNLARRSVFAFAVLASFYSKSFLLGTLYFSVVHISVKQTSKSRASAYSATSAYLPTRADISRWYATIFTYKLNRQIICLNISSTNIFVFLQRGGFTFIKRLIGLSITVASEAWLVLFFSPYGAMAASRGVEPLSSAWQANILTVERRSQICDIKNIAKFNKVWLIQITGQ